MAAEYDVDFRVRPEAYRYRSGEQGVFKVQPYKGELLPHWGFKDAETAREAVSAIRDAWQTVTDDPAYQRQKERHREEVYGSTVSPMVESER